MMIKIYYTISHNIMHAFIDILQLMQVVIACTNLIFSEQKVLAACIIYIVSYKSDSGKVLTNLTNGW